MSNQLIMTQLTLYGFPLSLRKLMPILDNINNLLDNRKNILCLESFEEIGKKCQHFRKIHWEEEDPWVKTDDGHIWLGGMEFNFRSGSVMIMIPFAEDLSLKDGIQLNRSVAVYRSGRVSIKKIITILKEIRSGLFPEQTSLLKIH